MNLECFLFNFQLQKALVFYENNAKAILIKVLGVIFKS